MESVHAQDRTSADHTGKQCCPAAAPEQHEEANMQHEITRLTGENFDLQEKIEALNEQVKILKRQHKLYLKKLAESGG